MRLIVTSLAIVLAAFPAVAVDDPFVGNTRGQLQVRIDLTGTNRVSLANGVEWFQIDAWRSLDISFGMVDVGNDGVPIVSAGGGSALSPAMQDLQSRMAVCGDDQTCLSATMMEFAQSAQSAVNPFEQMTGQQPGRYRNFAADRAGTCAKGTLVVEDILSGVVIPPPLPARAYKFTRMGSLTLPQDDFGLMDYACRVEVSLDQANGTMSLRLPAARLDVPVSLSAGGFTDETSTLLIEGIQSIELIDQPAGRDGAWTGVAEIGQLGSASHNSGQVVAPLRARISWSFSEG
jgi:hypothetical protein